MKQTSRGAMAWLLGVALATGAGGGAGVLLGGSVARADLRADELLLVVNGNAGDSVRAAEFYAKARLVPDGRIVKLDLPAQEEISFEVYEKNVVPVIRAFLRERKLESQVRCLVTFYGTPLRVRGPEITDQVRAEIETCKAERNDVERKISGEVAALEEYVKSKVDGFVPTRPATENPVDAMIASLDQSARALLSHIQKTSDLTEVALMVSRLKTSWDALLGEPGMLELFGSREVADPATPEETKRSWRQRAEAAHRVRATLQLSYDRRFDPTERARSRELVKQSYGLIPYARLLAGQMQYFGMDQAHASFDSELSLLWWDWYPRDKWLVNPLHFGAVGIRGAPTLMVSRLDGPDDSSAMEMILASLRAEKNGLRGSVVIDSRGLPDKTGDAYAAYDKTLRNLALLLKEKSGLKVVLDEQEALLPDNSQSDVAVYAGWYSPRSYKPTCRFVPGAVGYHIASYELTTMREPNAKAWVPNLIKAGMTATTGPVAEPYLFAFPEADQFFPLLFTGELTLAECYWKTQKTTSWQMSLVGDPLYRPFAKDPVLKVSDLPPALRAAFPPQQENANEKTPLSTQPSSGANR